MSILSVEYITLGGSRFQVREGRFTRSHLVTNLEQIKATRAESPFLDAVVTGFGAGIKPEPMSDAADWIADAAGMEPYGPNPDAALPLLRIGKTLEQAYSAAGAGELLPLVADRGVLYAGEQGGDTVLHSPDGTTWTAVSTGSGGTAVTALAAMDGVAWAGFDNSLVYLSDDGGATWAQAMDMTSVALPDGTIAGGAQAASCSVILPDPIHPVQFPSTQYVYYVGENYAGHGTTKPERNAILCWQLNFTTSGVTHGLCLFNEPYCKAGIIHEGDIWVCTAETAGPVRGVIYRRPTQTDVNPGAGAAPYVPPTRVATIDGDYAVGVAAWRGKTYWGTAGGAVYACDGSAVELLRSFATTKPIRGLLVKDGALMVGVHDDATGRLEAWRWDGTAWSQPHYVAATLTDAGQMVEFDGRLHIAAGNGTTRKVYAVSGTDNHLAARIVLPDADFAVPADAKRYRALVLQHSALAAGQAVEALYSLDGGSYVSLGTNWRVGSTRTQFALPEGVIGGRLSAEFSFTNLAALDLYTYGGKVHALPAPDARETWDADLILAPRDGHAWSDAAADTADAIAKWELLAALHDRCVVFEAVDPFRDGSNLPRRVMLATLDIQSELSADFSRLLVEGAQGSVRVKVLQAAQPENLLSNASFERDGLAAAPTDWVTFGTGTSALTASPGSTPAGLYSLLVTFDGVSAQYGVRQFLTGLPGGYYTFSAYVARVTTAGSVRLEAYDGTTGTILYGASATLGPDNSGEALHRVSVTFLLPAASDGTLLVQLRGFGTPAGAVYWDAAQLERGAPASPFRERGT